MFFLHFQRLRVIWSHIRRQGSASVSMTDGETGYTHYLILFVALQDLCQRLHGREFSLLWLCQYQNSEVFVNATLVEEPELHRSFPVFALEEILESRWISKPHIWTF
ncbi:uncharacterized protein LOC133740011 [Rosa rugosa]|uniref:uncharacterized protein LOC133740011 n=1 Tax=Rosa rugosa TaxID=74645 RepID=UPI002B414B2F|nr:uncharacterized protein LOC133740011 [Rosa rugosa]